MFTNEKKKKKKTLIFFQHGPGLVVLHQCV
jgi:hypothetical protein